MGPYGKACRDANRRVTRTRTRAKRWSSRRFSPTVTPKSNISCKRGEWGNNVRHSCAAKMGRSIVHRSTFGRSLSPAGRLKAELRTRTCLTAREMGLCSKQLWRASSRWQEAEPIVRAFQRHLEITGPSADHTPPIERPSSRGTLQRCFHGAGGIRSLSQRAAARPDASDHQAPILS